MYKILSLLLFTSCLSLSGCATTLLDQTFPKESTQTTSITLKQDQIIALGQAVQNQTEQGLIFIGKDFNYLMTDGSTQLLTLLNAIPAEQRSLTSPSPLVLTMEDPNHFSGVLQIRYNTRMVDLDQKQKVLLKSLGFRQNFDLIQNQESAPYPYINVFFKGQLYQALDQQKSNKNWHSPIQLPYNKRPLSPPNIQSNAQPVWCSILWRWFSMWSLLHHC